MAGSERRRLPRIRAGAVVALAVTAATAAWVVAGRSDTSAPAQPTVAAPSASPHLVSAAELSAGTTEGSPVYWVGPQGASTYELTRMQGGRVFVRYLQSPTQLGSPQPDFLAVATYEQPNAYAAIEAAARRPGAITIHPPNGGLAVYDRARPTSVFLAYPGGTRQIEVYAPSAAWARRLVRSGAVTPVPVPGVPRVVSARELSRFAASRGSGLFWAGTRPGTVIELTETRQGNLFVRYLPNASRVGSPEASFLVVATYGRPDAFADLQAAAARPGAVRLRVRGGGLAVYDRTHPTSVYLAYPHSDRQVEVYDPNASEARRLVSSGAIVRVP